MPHFPNAQWRGPVPNVGGSIGAVRLGVVHIMAGTLNGTDGWFHNPDAQVSAHFGTGKDGRLMQWVDTDVVAWAEANYNGEAISVENEGQSGDTLTPAQAEHLAQIMAWTHAVHGVPLVRTSDPNGAGWIGHGELGQAGGAHPDCPGGPILAQLPAILARAVQIAGGAPPAPPKPPPPPTLYSPVPPPLALLIGGSAMAALDKMDMLIGTVNWAYFEYLGRLADPGGEKTYVTMLNEKGITAVIKSLATSAEGKAYQAAKRKSLGL